MCAQPRPLSTTRPSSPKHAAGGAPAASSSRARAAPRCPPQVVPEFLDWFANYLVVKRAAQEANFHRLYCVLMDRMADKELMRLLLRTTHYYVSSGAAAPPQPAPPLC